MARYQSSSWFLLLQFSTFFMQFAAASVQFPDLFDATLSDLRRGLDSGHFTSFDLTAAYIARINEVNQQLRAVTTINPDALAIALELDKARSKPNATIGPLHGIPILLKDNIATNDRMDNTAGSFALVGARVREDSTVAAKLRRAGAVILGKANMSEWAGWRTANNTAGWSATGGQTLGAYFPGQELGGSSSGSAVSAAIGLAWASVGTETVGSIIVPAQDSNLVGIKPTVGLTSRYLVVPVSEHKDSVGPLARTVKDAAYLLSAIAGRDRRDSFTDRVPFADAPDYAAACKKTALRGKRIGIPREVIRLCQYSGVVEAKYNETIGVLRASGAVIVEDVELSGFAAAYDIMNPFIMADFQTSLPKLYLGRLAKNPHRIGSVRDLQAFTRRDPREDYPAQATELWQRGLDQGFGSDSAQFRDLLEAMEHYGGRNGIDGALERYRLDAVFVPSGVSSTLAGYVGNPVVTIPIGRMPDDTAVEPSPFGPVNMTAPNCPYGVAFTGARFSEEVLIGMAYALEQKTQVRKTIRPYVAPTIGLEDVVEICD